MALNKPALNKPAVGGDLDVWGGKLNTNVDNQDVFNEAVAVQVNANETAIGGIGTNKLDKGTYTGTADDLNTAIDGRLEKGGYVGTAQTLDNNKVDKVTGKDLSSNDFTDTLKDKLDNIEAGSQVNVQSDWNQTDNTQDDYINNKPTTISDDQSKSIQEFDSAGVVNLDSRNIFAVNFGERILENTNYSVYISSPLTNGDGTVWSEDAESMTGIFGDDRFYCGLGYDNGSVPVGAPIPKDIVKDGVVVVKQPWKDATHTIISLDENFVEQEYYIDTNDLKFHFRNDGSTRNSFITYILVYEGTLTAEEKANEISKISSGRVRLKNIGCIECVPQSIRRSDVNGRVKNHVEITDYNTDIKLLEASEFRITGSDFVEYLSRVLQNGTIEGDGIEDVSGYIRVKSNVFLPCKIEIR